MEKHPFFMTKTPEAGEPLSPLMEGLQQLKYSESDNTPQGTAALCVGRLQSLVSFSAILINLFNPLKPLYRESDDTRKYTVC
jgi:hypothetical protein